ncbi:unnamed protein product [Arctogadus glacialis]
MEPNYCLPVGLNLSSLSRGVIGPRYAQFSQEIDGVVEYPSPPTELYPDTHRCTCATKDVTKHLFLSDADEEEHIDGGMVLMGFPGQSSDAGVGVTSLWIISSSCSSEYINMKALTGLLLLVFGHGVSSVLHSMQFFYTGSSGLTTFPEFVAVGMVDGVQINYYDSNTQRVVLKQDWMEQVTREDTDYLERSTGIYLGYQQTFKANIGTLKKNFNQIGVWLLWLYEEEDSPARWWDLKTLTWLAAVPQAVPTTQSWNEDKADLQYLKYYYTKQCVDWLKTLLAYGKSTLQRTGSCGDVLDARGSQGVETKHSWGASPRSLPVDSLFILIPSLFGGDSLRYCSDPVPYTALHRSTPPYTALHRPTVPYTALHHPTVPYTALHHSTPLYNPLHRSTPLYNPLHRPTPLYTAQHYPTPPYSPLHRSTALHRATPLYNPPTPPYTALHHPTPLYTALQPPTPLYTALQPPTPPNNTLHLPTPP